MPRQQERYCAKLVSEALGSTGYEENHTFDFLRGDPTPKRPNGAKLPVDAYFPEFQLTLEFRESQHYTQRVKLWDERVTATGDLRREQRRRYDERREDILPSHGVRLLIVYDCQLTGNCGTDLKFVKDRLAQLLGRDHSTRSQTR